MVGENISGVPIIDALVAHQVRSTAEAYLGFPVAAPHDHTMGDALTGYVAQRVPGEVLRERLRQGWRVEVHGLPAELVEREGDQIGLPGPIVEIDLAYNRWGRARCARRPIFYEVPARQVIAVAVISGADYIRHYAALLRHYVHFEVAGVDAGEAVCVVSYPEVEANLLAWTGFDGAVQPGDVVLYGYASDFLSWLEARRDAALTRLEGFENYYYYAARRRLPDGRALCFYECKHHGWGNLSADTMGRAAELGAHEVHYISKGASCEGPEAIYDQIYCPTRYAVCRYDAVVAEAGASLPNRLVEAFPGLDTGRHLSPPCVMEEDYVMREVATSFGARSLDNEAARIAARLEAHNLRGGAQVGFTAMQFPTDYVRRRDERDLEIDFSLENNRRAPAEARRRAIKERMFAILERYFFGEG